MNKTPEHKSPMIRHGNGVVSFFPWFRRVHEGLGKPPATKRAHARWVG